LLTSLKEINSSYRLYACKPHVACVASVSVGFGSKDWCFACAENGARAKNEIWGWGKGRKETLPSFPSPIFYSPNFCRCNSLLPNPTETLATQAKATCNKIAFCKLVLNVSFKDAIKPCANFTIMTSLVPEDIILLVSTETHDCWAKLEVKPALITEAVLFKGVLC